jgi:hypothetical protein
MSLIIALFAAVFLLFRPLLSAVSAAVIPPKHAFFQRLGGIRGQD